MTKVIFLVKKSYPNAPKNFTVLPRAKHVDNEVKVPYHLHHENKDNDEEDPQSFAPLLVLISAQNTAIVPMHIIIGKKDISIRIK